jgi:hypothetical protein
MGALFPSEVIVKIGAAGLAGSAAGLVTFTTRLTSFKESGGERDQDTVPTFGNANIINEKPRSQIEVAFDCILQYSDVLLFDQLISSSVIDGSTAVTSATDPTDKVVYVQWYDGSTYHTRGYNNATAVTFEPEMSADEYLKGSITFKLAPTNESGVANVKKQKAAMSTFPSW